MKEMLQGARQKGMPSDWKGFVDTPKSGRGRAVPLTEALFAALTKNRHLRADRVLALGDGSPRAGAHAA